MSEQSNLGQSDSRSDEDRALDSIAFHLKDAGFPWSDRERDRQAVKQALIAVGRRGFRIRIDVEQPL